MKNKKRPPNLKTSFNIYIVLFYLTTWMKPCFSISSPPKAVALIVKK